MSDVRNLVKFFENLIKEGRTPHRKATPHREETLQREATPRREETPHGEETLQREARPEDCQSTWYKARKGLVLIFSQNSKNPKWKREGNDEDVRELTRVWNVLGATVEHYPNLSQREITEHLSTWSQLLDASEHCENVTEEVESLRKKWDKNLRGIKNIDYLVLIVMSHGGNDHKGEFVIDHAGERIRVAGTFYKFINSDFETLRGKPKVLIVNACRGKGEIKAIPLKTDAVPFAERRMDTTRLVPQRADVLIVHSTQAGNKSYRCEAQGTTFIQVLCHLLEKHRHKEFLEILTMLNHYVSSVLSDEDKRTVQMPCFTSSLRCKLQFAPQGSR